jgi:hypothetical protein
MVVVTGYLQTNTSDQIPLFNGSATNATEGDLSTDPALTVSAMNVGDYKPGATITHGLVVANTNSAGYCYLLRQGQIQTIIPIGVAGIHNDVQPLAKPVTLMPGDTVRFMPSAAASRLSVLSVYTSSGTCRIFKGTPAGAATTDLVDLQTGNSIGSTLQGEVITMASFNSVDGGKIISQGGAQILDAAGRLVSSIHATSVQSAQLTMSMARAPIALNYKAQVVTNA